jgi:hypothetical protein
VDEQEQISRAERLARVLGRLSDSSIDVLALLDALAMSDLVLDDDDAGLARAAWKHAVAEHGIGNPT